MRDRMDGQARFGDGWNLLSLARRYGGDIALGALIVGVVVLMIVPLRPWALDLLIALNIAISALVMSLALFVRNPLYFSSFPTLLLTATLYRLALNISSTRLILLRADAGRIIAGFGGFVVGGDILIGAVIFGILSMVLFLVITKGAERVAEVAARFTLDALPGMQMAIDADLRSGALSTTEARRRRADLERQSRYYGALDGAMKFVRGDAIVGVIIIGVNIVGGIAVGTLRHSMGILDALDLYGKLTIGDGLVTLIPALFVSTAAGLLVTRVGQSGGAVRLGRQLATQLWAEPWAIGTAALVCVLLGTLPGLPAWPFMLLSLSLGGSAIYQIKKRRQPWGHDADDLDGDSLRETRCPPVSFEFGEQLYLEWNSKRRRGTTSELSRRLVDRIRDELGLALSQIPIEVAGADLSPRGLRLKVRGVAVTPTPVFDGTNEHPDELEHRMWQLLAERKDRLIGVDEVQGALDKMAQEQPALVRESVPARVSLTELTVLCSSLAFDGIGLNHLPQILDGIVRIWPVVSPSERNGALRRHLAPAITRRVVGEEDQVQATTFDGATESFLLEGMITCAEGQRLVLDPSVKEELVETLGQMSSNGHAGEGTSLVLLVRGSLRAELAGVLRRGCPRVTVLAHGELEAETPIKMVQPLSLV